MKRTRRKRRINPFIAGAIGIVLIVGFSYGA